MGSKVRDSNDELNQTINFCTFRLQSLGFCCKLRVLEGLLEIVKSRSQRV